MFLSILLFLFLLLIIYLLLVPIIIYIDTNSNQYYIHFKGLAKVNLEEHQEEIIKIKLKILFFNFSFYPLKKGDSFGKKKRIDKKKSTKSRTRFTFQTGLRLLKSFKVKRLLLNIDTGNCITNAKLYPFFAFLNYYVGDFNINFEGKNQLELYIQNRPIQIIKSFINL